MKNGWIRNAEAAFLFVVVFSGVPAVGAGTVPAVDIGSRLEVFWDDYLVDTNLTTASRLVHQPEYVGEIMTFDKPWEGDGFNYHVIVPDRDARGDFYRMYYNSSSFGLAVPEECEFPATEIRICYAESRDGTRWTKPELGLVEFQGSKKNNIIIDARGFGFDWDNFMVFKDPNPDCPPDELYKGVAGHLEKDEDFGLWCFLSADGLHWRKGWLLTKDGEFDSFNVTFWDSAQKEYHCYFRSHHQLETPDRHGNVHARDVRHMVSKDFRAWSRPRQITFDAAVEDYALYTSQVQPYARTPHIYIGFPTRYVMRKDWADSFDKLPGLANRRFRSTKEVRLGQALTDCVFMMTRDGNVFHREEDAFIEPGSEQPKNWLYGDCFPIYGQLVLPGRRPGSDPELNFHWSEGMWTGKASVLLRYALRMDGFVSRHAPDAGARLVTKPFVFDGKLLKLNFRTSAYGRLHVTLRDASGVNAIRSHEIFGNKIDRVIGFTGGTVADFSGKPVVLEFDMHDADIYSFQFVNE